VAAYASWAANPAVAGALRGMGAVSAGLIAGTAVKLARSARGNPLGIPVCTSLGGAAFVLVGLLRIPLAWALLAVGPAACVLAWRRIGGGPP
jgi:chromate transporter